MSDEVKDTSLHSDLSAAFDKAETAATTTTTTEPVKTEPVKTEPVKTEPVKTEPAQLRGEGEPVKTEPVKTEPVKTEPVKTEPVKTEIPPEERWADRLAKAPPSWKPEAREHWAQLPPQARLEIHRRESEVYKALQHSKASRDFHQEFNEVAEPYAMLMAQEGGNLNGFSEYLKTASLLRMGTPMEKAMAVARAIHQFQVPIEMLDSALAGTLKQGNGGAGGGEFRDPRVDKLLGVLEQQNQTRQASMAAEVDTELEEFGSDPKNEYFEDVRDIMADVLEVAARRNEKMSLQQAYRHATMLHPGISKLVEQKGKVKTQEELTAAAKAAKAAAISVTGAPGAPGGVTASDGTVRSSIEAAIGQLSGR